MTKGEKELIERKSKSQAQYDEAMAEAKIERALVQYERRLSGWRFDRERDEDQNRG